MTEQERKAFDRQSLKLAEAYKKISRLVLGQQAPRRLQDILCSATFHLSVAMRQYKQMLADKSLDEQSRKKLQGHAQVECRRDLLDLFRFIHVPDKEDAAPATI